MKNSNEKETGKRINFSYRERELIDHAIETYMSDHELSLKMENSFDSVIESIWGIEKYYFTFEMMLINLSISYYCSLSADIESTDEIVNESYELIKIISKLKFNNVKI